MPSRQAQKIRESFPPKPRQVSSDLASIIAERRSWEQACEEIEPGTLGERTIKPFYYLLNPVATQSPSGTMTAILYAHGGGFTEGSARTHQHICQAIAEAAQTCVYNVEYSLAPEATYPIAVDELCALYNRIKHKHAAIYLMGDSAGGGLVMQAMMKLKASGDAAAVSGIVLISPWLDLLLEKHKGSAKDQTDPLVSYEALKNCADLYLAGQDATDPLISPCFARGESFPDMLILCGSEEMLLDDAVEFRENNSAHSHSRIELTVYDGMWHVWLGWMELEEAQRAIAQIGNFVRQTNPA